MYVVKKIRTKIKSKSNYSQITRQCVIGSIGIKHKPLYVNNVSVFYFCELNLQDLELKYEINKIFTGF